MFAKAQSESRNYPDIVPTLFTIAEAKGLQRSLNLTDCQRNKNRAIWAKQQRLKK
jgi:hypothetical protein